MRGLFALLSLLVLSACHARLPWEPPLPVGDFRVEGNVRTRRDDLVRAARSELESMVRGTHPEADAYDAAYAMERYLVREGFPDGKVDLADEGTTIVFRVEEGHFGIIRDVRFPGATHAPTATFVDDFLPEKGTFGRGARIWNEARESAGAARVETWYRAHGYLHAKVGPARAEWDPAHTTVDVVVPVVEDRRFVVADLRVAGDEASLVDRASWVGKPYRGGLAAEIAGDVRDALEERGFAHAEATPSVEIDEKKGEARITVHVRRGERVQLGTVRFEGLRRTNPGFLRRRIPVAEGALLRRSLLQKGLTNVYAVGAFRTIDQTLETVRPGVDDVVVKLEEAPSRRVDLGAGYGSWELARAVVAYKDFNFTGRGRFLELRGLAAVRHLGADVTVEDPWILGENRVASASIGVLRRIEPFYSFWGFHGEAYAEQTLPDKWKLRLGYRYEEKHAFQVDSSIPPVERGDVEGFSRSAGVFLRARWDRRDHLFLPTKGWLLDAGVFASRPELGANLAYVEVDAQVSAYVPLGKLTVLAFDVRGKAKPILGDRVTLPLEERYFLGGSESVRSFGQDQLTPVDAYRGGLGGRTAFEAHAELRRQLVESLHGAAFVDTGLVAERAFSLDGAWGYGVGLGLRYYTPVGPVRMDVAWNPGRWWAATRPWQVHFGFGFSF